MSDEKDPKEVTAEQISRLLDGDDPETVLSELTEAQDLAGREYAEVLGLLGYEAEPVQPAAEVRQRILAATAGRAAGTGEDDGAAPGGAVTPFQRPAPAAASAPSLTRWLMPLAASLVLLLLAWSVMLSLKLERQQATIARLSERLERAAAQQQELVRLQGSLQKASARLAHMTAPGVEICPLRPRGPAAAEQGAWGALYLTPTADQWYVTVRGLEPCPQGRVYRIWLMTSERPLMVAEFREGVDAVIEIDPSLRSDELSGVKVTLEGAEAADVPAGSTVLFGDEKMRVL